ncbi:MAG: hypothetical protein J5800_03240, partial [Spirochaetales bacterium]|nr:hypothetical protein [Spirochaetales bacterium]MBO4425360.1 hypothetical protein [Spirochaetales bacterium]
MLEKLKAEKRWFCWKLETRPGQDKPTKVPYSAKTGRKTGTDAKFSDTWTDFDSASKVCAERGYSGVGFKIPEDMFFLDIDHTTPDDPRVSRMKDLLNTYAEYSQSGAGVHFYGYVNSSKIPVEWNEREKKNKLASKYYQKNPNNGMELYFGSLTNRYAAFTGNVLVESELSDCTDSVLQILEKDMIKAAKYTKAEKKAPWKIRSNVYHGINDVEGVSREMPEGTPEKVIEIVQFLCHQRNGAKFAALYFDGDKSAYLNDAGQVDDSRADAALCAMIAFRVGDKNRALIEEVFNYSALYREKWSSRQDYREATIDAGIRACNGNFHRLSKDMPAYMYINHRGEVCCNPALLAEHVRENVDYILVRDNGKQGILVMVYNHGVYTLYAPDMFKAIIKYFIAEYDNSLVKMKDVDEAYRHIVTDFDYVRQSDLNFDETIINFQNTIVRVSGDQILTFGHNPQVISTIQIPCNWTGKETPTPVFDRYIMRLCDYDPHLEDLVMEIIGVCLSNVKGYRMKKAPFFYGDGDTGKSQLKALVERLLGQGNYIGIDLQEIEARFGTGAIYGMRLAGSSDMSFMSVDELKTFKKITGGDSLFAEFKGQQGFEYTYSGMLWFCMNRLPKFGGDDGKWVYDRILPIHCVNVIPKEEQDKCLLDKMYAEREGIVYKAVKALQRVIANGYRFSEPQCVKRERQKYMTENNTVKAFFDQCMTFSPKPPYDPNETVARIYDVYKEWCKDYNSGYSKTMKEFRDTISEYLGLEYSQITIHKRRGTIF